MSTSDDTAAWVDFDALRHNIKSNTVDRLKHIITGLAEECGAPLSKTGKKQELIDRITAELDRYRYMHQPDQWKRARAVLHQVRTSGVYTSSAPTRTFAANSDFLHNNVHGSAYIPPRPSMAVLHSSTTIPSGPLPRYDPYAPPRRPVPTPSNSTPPRPSIPVRFKSSPFYKIDQAVSSVVECPESTGSIDRRSQALHFTLNQEQVNKLLQNGSKYQLRLYCTTSTFHTAAPGSFRSNAQPCPIEFPATCEVRVNNNVLQANLKGIKKKPGTAPPADLRKMVRLGAGIQNRIDMVYVNSQANTGPKKFYLVVYLVEVSSVEELVERLKKGKFRSVEEIKSQMAKAGGEEDEEIVIGKQKMSLKCPLSYARIKEPCRSDKCVHSQCFDAFSWYTVMEQTTTWLCPVCEKVLNPEELIIDGYFHDILDQTPDSIEEVELEPDGEWHSGDNRYGSRGWINSHRNVMAAKATNLKKESPVAQDLQSALPSAGSSNISQSATTRRREDVVVLDSDSEYEDESQVKRELSPSTPLARSVNVSRNGTSSSIGSSEAGVSAVIDLTLESDDEDRPPPPPPPTAKRKASDVLENSAQAVHKKSRATDSMPLPSLRKDLMNGYPNGTSASAPSLHAPLLQRQTSASSQRTHRSPSVGSGSRYPPQSPPAPVTREYEAYLGYNQVSVPVSYSYATDGPPPHAQSASAYHSYPARASNGGKQPWP